jgi:hypothetical protein
MSTDKGPQCALPQSAPDSVLVERLWELYAWPERNLPMRKMTIVKLLTYRAQPCYVSDEARTWKQPSRAWDYGRIRYFYECLLAGRKLDAIDVDNVCSFGRIYPEPVILDGHHRFAASHLASTPRILVNYSGRIDLLRYLTGARKTCPTTPV